MHGGHLKRSFLPLRRRSALDRNRHHEYGRKWWKADIERANGSDYVRGIVLDGENRIWSAMLHVRPMPGHAGGLEYGTAGAFAVVLSLARNEAHYREIVAAEMLRLGLFIAEVEHSSLYVADKADTKELRLSAARLSPEWPVQYHDFHAYPHDDA